MYDMIVDAVEALVWHVQHGKACGAARPAVTGALSDLKKTQK